MHTGGFLAPYYTAECLRFHDDAKTEAAILPGRIYASIRVVQDRVLPELSLPKLANIA